MSTELLSSSNVDLITKIGDLLNQADFENAYAHFTTLLEYEPNNPSYLVAAGKCALDYGDSDAALGHFKRAHQIKPSSQTAKNLAELFFKTGNYEEALVLLP